MKNTNNPKKLQKSILCFFCLFLQRSDLTQNNGPDQYQVRADYSVRELKTKLRDCSSRVSRAGCGYIVEDDGFDILFSVLNNFHSEMPTDHKRTAMETMIVAATDWARQADAFLCSGKHTVFILPLHRGY